MGSLRLAVRAFVVGAFGVAAAAGCAGKTKDPSGAELCPDLCKKGKSCPGAPVISSCDDFCLGEDARAEVTGCHPQYDKAETCLSELDDICTGPKACANEIKATNDCEFAYCAKHPGDDVCVVPTE